MPSRSYPYVTVSLVFVNIAVFLYQAMLREGYLWKFIHTYGIVPERYASPSAYFTADVLWNLLPLVTSTFLHGGVAHLAGNMLFLWVFGDNVEDRLGRARFLAFYLLCGALANLAHIITHPLSAVPTIGASGAIAGVMGAYLIMFPRASVLTFFPIFPLWFVFVVLLLASGKPPLWLLGIFYVPAPFFLVLWAVFQVYSGFMELPFGHAIHYGTAWWAHIGGFAVGWWLAQSWGTKKRRVRLEVN